MRIKITFFTIFLAVLLIGYKSNAQVGLNWAVTDSAHFTADSATFSAMAVSKANGHIYVAYRDAATSNKLTVRRFNGSTWSILGSAGISVGAVSNCAIAVTGNIVYVAYSEAASGNRLRVMRYNGSSWSDDGANSIRDASSISIAIAPSANVYVSCLDEGYAGGAGRVIVFERNITTNTWSNISGTGISAGTSTSIDMDVDFLGDVYVLYRDANTSNKATVKKYDFSATTWSTIGTEGFSAGAVSSCALKIDKVGNPVISYVDASVSNALKIFKRNGSAWADITGILGVTGANAENKMYIGRDNSVIVGFKAGSGAFTVYKHNALSNSWTNLGNPKGNTTTVSDIGLDTDNNDKLFVCYTEPTQRFKTNVRQLNCSAPPKPTITVSGNPICGGSKADLQSSNTSSNVASLWNRSFDNYEAHSNKLADLNDNDLNNGAMSAATSPSGELWVVKARKPTNEIVVKRFTNNSWVNVGSGIVFTDGETDGNSTDIAFHPDGTCYVSFIASNGDAGFKKWNGSAWVQENFGWSTLSDTCKHTALSINPYGVIAFATSMKDATTGNYRPIVFTKINGTWSNSGFLNYDASSLDVAVDMNGSSFLAVTDQLDRSQVVSYTIPNGKVRIIRVNKNNTTTNMGAAIVDFGHYIQIECSKDNNVFVGYREEKKVIGDQRTSAGYRLLNGASSFQKINGGLCEHGFTMGVSKAGKLFFVSADDYGSGTVLLTSINAGTNFAGIVSNYFQNNSISVANTYYRGLQMVFDENDAPIIVTSTAIPNTVNHGDLRVYRVDRVGLGEANPLLTNTAGTYFTESNTGCGAVDTSSVVTITKTSASNNWTGAVNNTWGLAGNWGCNRVPNADDEVVIPTGLSNYPIITSSVSAVNRVVNSLFLGSNASVTIDGTTLALKDSIAVASTSNINTQNNGYFVFDGSSTQRTSNLQRINGGVRINNASNVILSGNLNITGALDFVNGKIVTNNFTLRAPHNLISSGDANSYIATSLQNGADVTSGGLITAVPAGAGAQFPVGTLTSYTPVSVSNTAGANDSITVAVDAAPIITANSNRHLNVTWNLTEKNAGNNTYSLTLFWNTANEGSLFSRSACGLVRSNGSSTITYATGAAGATSVLPSFYSRTATGITALSPWSVSSDATILPIELLSFNTSQEANLVKLNWEVSAGSNPYHFEIEQSTNGIEFKSIEIIKASTATKYSTVDASNKEEGYYYYRLKMIDKDGKITFSNTRKIYIGTNKFSIEEVYPQPVKSGSLNVKLNATKTGDMKYSITDVAGKVIVNAGTLVKKGNNNLTINISNLKSGTYYLSFYNDQIKSNTMPVIVY
jgi:hypothetical protein